MSSTKSASEDNSVAAEAIRIALVDADIMPLIRMRL